MTRRPDLILINVAFDAYGVHGHMYFRDSTGSELRRVNVSGAGDVDEYKFQAAPGDARDGWDPYFYEAGWLMALVRPDTAEERS